MSSRRLRKSRCKGFKRVLGLPVYKLYHERKCIDTISEHWILTIQQHIFARVNFLVSNSFLYHGIQKVKGVERKHHIGNL